MSSRAATLSAEAKRPNKAKLAQERSRVTRRKIVKAAIQLWNSRGFDQGFDETTVDDIADAAAVSRATVYYYFPKKEDILRELAWSTAEQVYELTVRSMMSGKALDAIFDAILGDLGAMILRNSPAAVNRMLRLRDNDREAIERDTATGGMTRAFSVALLHAQEMGEISKDISASEVGEVISNIVMGCISKWSIVGDLDLIGMLRRRVRIVLAGVHSRL